MLNQIIARIKNEPAIRNAAMSLVTVVALMLVEVIEMNYPTLGVTIVSVMSIAGFNVRRQVTPVEQTNVT